MPFDDKGNWIPPGGKWAGQEHEDNVKQAEQMTPDEQARRQDAPQVENYLNSLPQSSSDSGGDSSLGKEWEGYNPFSANNQEYIYNHTLSPVQDFLNRAATHALSTDTFGILDKPIAQNDLLPDSLRQDYQPAQTFGEKAADVTGDLAGFMLPGPGNGVLGLGEKAAVSGLEKLAPNAPGWITSLAKGLGGGASYGTADQLGDMAFDTHNDGDQTLGQRLAKIGETAAGFGAFNLGGYGLGKALEKTGLGDKLSDFIGKYTNKPTDTMPTGEPQDITQEPSQEPVKTPTQEQSTNNTMNEPTPSPLMEEYNQAVQDEFSRLKDIRNNPYGIENGGLIRDEEGYVTGAYPTVSNNPQWYRDFFTQFGRKPTNDELMTIAKDHVLNGEQDNVTGNTTAWKPQAAKELEDEINNIQGMMGQVDPATRESLQKTTEELQSGHDDIMSQYKQTLSDHGVIGNSGGSIGHNTDEVKGFFGNNTLSKNGKTNETIARNEVVNNLRKNLGLTIDTGRLISKGAQGEYKVKPEVIRSARQGDISTISHEIGHHLEKRLSLIDPKYQQDLEKIAAPLVKGNKAYTPADYADEGLAEFFRRYLTEDPQQLRSEVPDLYDHIMSKLDGAKIRVKVKNYDVMKGLNQAQKDIHTWANQGEINQAIGMIDFKGNDKEPFFSKDKWYTQFVDDLNPLKLFEKTLTGKLGLGSDSIYKMARNSRGVAEQAKLAIERGIYLNGNKIGEGLSEIVKPLEKLGVDQKEFAAYMVAKHSADLKTMGKNTTFDDAHIQALNDKFDGTPVEKIQKEVVQYNNHLLDILTDAEMLSKEAVDEMRAKYPNYVPFMRYFDDDAINGFKNGGFGASKGFANLTNPVKRMSEEGSQRTIINPFESMVKNTFLVMNAAAKNKVGLQLAEMSKMDGAGAWVEHLGEGGRDSKEHIVTVFQDGKPNQYKMRDPELYNAMLSLDNESSTFAIRFLSGAASLLRSGAVLTPEFMARNVFRDVQDAFLNVGFNPLLVFKGAAHVFKKDEMFDKFLASGGAQSVLMSLDRNFNRESLKEVFRESMKDKAMHVVTSPKELLKLFSGYTPVKGIIKGLRKGAEFSELSTRVGKFAQTLNKTGNLDEAAYQARDLMDFGRAGSNIRQYNRAAAFLNAQIQGVDKMQRSFRENPASYLTRATISLVLPSVATYYINQNLDPERKKIYDNIPDWQKDSFFVLPIPNTNEFMRIPKPFEAGMIFSTGTEHFLRYLNGQDPKAKDYIKGLWSTFTPNIMPTAMMPILEAITNYSFFQQKNIVPTSEQKMEKQDQYGPNTSQLAKVIGNLVADTPFGDTSAASPRIIDNTIKGYTAGLGQYAVSGIDAALNGLGITKKIPQPEKNWTEYPLINAFTVNTNGGGQIRQDFYDRLDELTQERNSDKRNQTPFIGQDLQDYARMNAVKNGIDQLMKVYKQAQSSSNIDSSRKKEILDNLDQRMNQLAAIGLNRR